MKTSEDSKVTSTLGIMMHHLADSDNWKINYSWSKDFEILKEIELKAGIKISVKQARLLCTISLEEFLQELYCPCVDSESCICNCHEDKDLICENKDASSK